MYFEICNILILKKVKKGCLCMEMYLCGKGNFCWFFKLGIKKNRVMLFVKVL